MEFLKLLIIFACGASVILKVSFVRRELFLELSDFLLILQIVMIFSVRTSKFSDSTARYRAIRASLLRPF